MVIPLIYLLGLLDCLWYHDWLVAFLMGIAVVTTTGLLFEREW